MILTSTVNHYVVFTQLTPQGRKETIGNEKRTGTNGLDLLQDEQYVSGDRWQRYRVDAGVPGVDGIPGARGN